MWRHSRRNAGEIQRLEILSVKKEAKLLASEVTKVEEGKGGKDLRCSDLHCESNKNTHANYSA